MARPADSVKLFLTLVIFWILLNGSVQPGALAIGVAVALTIVFFFRDTLSVLSGHRLTGRAIWVSLQFVGYFLRELVKANLQMAAIVLDPRLPVEPAIVAVKVRLTHPVARLLLANSITLTPGTLSVEYKGDTLYVHWVVARGTDTETATREIVAGFERYLEQMYD
ncbi:MAG: hypothetical protein CSA74_09580 [Rhodobacterales bacterium]|nr:MAG: hypothetical protein CSA74_09580 [Rhodobacterales bacterium]